MLLYKNKSLNLTQGKVLIFCSNKMFVQQVFNLLRSKESRLALLFGGFRFAQTLVYYTKCVVDCCLLSLFWLFAICLNQFKAF